MKTTPFIYAALIALSPWTGWGDGTPRQDMKEGIRLYEKNTYDGAADSFHRAAQSASKDQLDVSVAKYNEANARFKLGQFGAAATNYADATRSPDLALQSKAYYNRGNALIAASEGLEKQGGLDTAAGSVDEAIEMFENAITLAPGDEDAKVNYELALKKKQELQQKQQQQQKQDQNKKDQDQKNQPQNNPSQKQEEQKKQDSQQSQPKDSSQDQKQQPQNAGQPQPEKPSSDPQKQQAQPQKSEEMTPEEAKIMLDAMKQEEQASRDRMRLIIGQPSPVDKDW